jgi:hypothetical protein
MEVSTLSFPQAHSSEFTYSAGVQNLAGVAGDNLIITGFTGGVVRVKRISISSSASASQTINANIIKRSTLDTGGTFVALGGVPHDPQSPANQCTVGYYTAAPTPGTQVGSLLRAAQIFINTAGGTPGITVFDFGDNNDQGITLRLATHLFTLNLGSAPTNSPNIGIDIEWVESSD